MRKLSILITLFIGIQYANTQNLVPNPSFELTTGCPGGIPAVNNWYLIGGHTGSPDAFNGCTGSGPSFGMPVNVFGNQMARTGICYIGFVTRFVSAGFREYVQIQLTTPLTAGMTYDVEAYVSLSDGSGYGTGGYQFLFTNTAVNGPGGNQALTMFSPQVANPIGNHITDKVNWVQVSGSFVAAGGEQYLTLGNFFDDPTTTFSVVTGWTWNYSYMDDVSVVEATVLSENVTDLAGKWIQDNRVALTWKMQNLEGHQQIEILRATGSTIEYETVGEIKLDPADSKVENYTFDDPTADRFAPNFYRLRFTDANGKLSYSNTIEIAAPKPGDYLLQIFPNPQAEGKNLHLELVLSSPKSVHLEWMDVQGNLLKSSKLEGSEGRNQFSISTDGFSPGFYFLKIKAGNIIRTEKVVIR